jgi:hypothetical protein
VLAYLAPFVACIVVCLAAAWGLDRTIQALHLGWLNRIAGASLAGLAAAIILAIVIITGARYSSAWAEACASSTIPPRLTALLNHLPPATPEATSPEPILAEPPAAPDDEVPEDLPESP